jgi:hypothetical protein
MKKAINPINFKVTNNTKESWDFSCRRMTEMGLIKNKTDLFETLVRFCSNAPLDELKKIKATSLNI